MKLAALSFHIKDVGVEGLSQLNHLFLPSDGQTMNMARLKSVQTSCGASELFYLTTCNRFELILAFEGAMPESFSLETSLIPRAFLGKKSVVDHLLGVALSRDSVVFGENQIMGQIKNAFNEQRELGTVGSILTRILGLVLREAKAIRTEMGLSNYHTSVAGVAARSVLQFFREHTSGARRVMMIGAGESNQIFARFLAKRELRDLFWLNRTQSRAIMMAQEIGGHALDWSAFVQLISSPPIRIAKENAELPEVDVICCATGADRLLVTAEVLAQTKPRMVVDISMPTNTDRHLVEASGAVYLGLDEINQFMKLERSRYEEILREMNDQIRESTSRLMGELLVHQAGHVIKESVERSEFILNEVWEESLPEELKSLSDDQRQALQRWSQKLAKRLTHTHLETLKVVLKKPTE